MFRKFTYIFLLLLICSVSNAQIPPTGIKDEGGTETKPVFTIDCVGDGIDCSHSGITGTVTVTSSTVLCPSGKTGDFCFVYENSVLKLYVGTTLQTQWPITAVTDSLLLESGDYLLLESGDKLLLE